MKNYLLRLPYPPSANRLWRTGKGRTYLSPQAEAFKRTVALAVKARGILRPLLGQVKVSIAVVRPRARGDLDNRIKATLDALVGCAIVDDEQVVELHAIRYTERGRGRVEVFLEEVARADA